MEGPSEYERVDFCTLGMFIIDDIYPPILAKSQSPQLNVIGGAGTYSAIGARLFSAPPSSRSVGWIVDAGTDFTPELHASIAGLETGVLVRSRDAPTTRGWNGYGANDYRAFKYLTEKKRITADDLTPDLLAARSFHLICAPARCIEIVKRIHERRATIIGLEGSDPVFIWEPVPDLCTPAELQNTKDALKYVDVISPNHDELGSLFSFEHSSGVDKTAVERHTNDLLSHGVGSQGLGAVVVRAGKEGCLVATPEGLQWLPAYHTQQEKVVDPTGGGNGFLGGLAVGLVRTQFDVVEAAKWGSISASFCIEQVGIPTLTAAGNRDFELWNGVSVQDRLRQFSERINGSEPDHTLHQGHPAPSSNETASQQPRFGNHGGRIRANGSSMMRP